MGKLAVDKRRAYFYAAVEKEEGATGKPYGVDGQFSLIDFDFSLVKDRNDVPTSEVERVRA